MSGFLIMEVAMDKEKIINGVKLVLEGIGEDTQREGLQETPQRVSEMVDDVLGGLHQVPQLTTFVSENLQDEMVVVKDIPFYSMCEHHLLPFFGRVHLAYLPDGNRITGFSALTRVVEIYSCRLQIQERFTNQIADLLMEQLKPKGAWVQVEAKQLCVCMRGSKKDGVTTLTQAIRGNIPLDRLKITGLIC